MNWSRYRDTGVTVPALLVSTNSILVVETSLVMFIYISVEFSSAFVVLTDAELYLQSQIYQISYCIKDLEWQSCSTSDELDGSLSITSSCMTSHSSSIYDLTSDDSLNEISPRPDASHTINNITFTVV